MKPTKRRPNKLAPQVTNAQTQGTPKPTVLRVASNLSLSAKVRPLVVLHNKHDFWIGEVLNHLPATTIRPPTGGATPPTALGRAQEVPDDGSGKMDLVKAMLKVLADCYSQTAKYMLKAMESGSEEYWRLANREYIAESFVRTGLLPNGYADEDLRRRIAKAQRRKIRDKNPWDKELALHYYAKHYNTMTPKELSAALTVATKKRITRANASRRRQRLGLVSANREGRPDWKRYKT